MPTNKSGIQPYHLLAGEAEIEMKNIPLLAPAAAAAVLLSAMVIAAPQGGKDKGQIATAPDRTEGFLIASAD